MLVPPPFSPLSMPSAPFDTCRLRFLVVRGLVCPRKRNKIVVTSRAATRRALARNSASTSPCCPGNDFTRPPSHTHTGTRPAISVVLGLQKQAVLPASYGQAVTTKQQAPSSSLHHFGPPPRPGPRLRASSSCGSPLAHHHPQHSKSMAELCVCRGNVAHPPPSLPSP